MPYVRFQVVILTAVVVNASHSYLIPCGDKWALRARTVRCPKEICASTQINVEFDSPSLMWSNKPLVQRKLVVFLAVFLFWVLRASNCVYASRELLAFSLTAPRQLKYNKTTCFRLRRLIFGRSAFWLLPNLSFWLFVCVPRAILHKASDQALVDLYVTTSKYLFITVHLVLLFAEKTIYSSTIALDREEKT